MKPMGILNKPERFTVTAFVPGHQRNRLGTWTDGRQDRFGRVKVVETFEAESVEAAKERMVRLLVPLGITICESRAIKA